MAKNILFILFLFSFYTVVAQPANDNCLNGLSLYANENCYVSTINAATASGGGSPDPAGTCTEELRTVWFQYISNSSNPIYIYVDNVSLGLATDVAMGVFTGNCGAFTEIACADVTNNEGDEFVNLTTGVANGNVYYIMIAGAGVSDNVDFCISITQHITPPNDDCANAVALNPNDDCLFGHTFYATPNTGGTSDPLALCMSNNHSVWYKYTSISAQDLAFNVFNHTHTGINDLAMAVYTGPNCNSLVPQDCKNTFGAGYDEGFSTAGGVFIGQTYYIMVSGATLVDVFDFCIAASQTPPITNEPCSNYLNLPVQDRCRGDEILYYIYNLDLATSTGSGNATQGTVGATSCTISGMQDVFFSVTVPAGEDGFTLELNNYGGCSGGSCDYALNMYEANGSCSSSSLALTPLSPSAVNITDAFNNIQSPECIDLSTIGNVSLTPMVFEGLNAGETYYFRLTEQQNQGGMIEIGAYTNLIEDACDKPQPIPLKGCNYYANGSDFKTPVNVTPAGGWDCSWSSMDNSVFYYFEIDATTPQPVSITITDIECSSNASMQMAIWGTTNGTSICSTVNQTSAKYHGCASGTGVLTLIPDGNLNVAGTQPLDTGTYYLVVDGFGGSNCTWGFFSTQIMPVEWLSIEGNYEEPFSHLTWTVSEQSQCLKYEIERSPFIFPAQFEKIGDVSVNQATHLYEFWDKNLTAPHYFYRIRSVENDGAGFYSPTIEIKTPFNPFTAYAPFPNPTQSILHLPILSPDIMQAKIEIWDYIGNKLWEEQHLCQVGMSQIDLNVQMLPTGFYFIKIVAENGKSYVYPVSKN